MPNNTSPDMGQSPHNSDLRTPGNTNFDDHFLDVVEDISKEKLKPIDHGVGMETPKAIIDLAAGLARMQDYEKLTTEMDERAETQAKAEANIKKAKKEGKEKAKTDKNTKTTTDEDAEMDEL
ncbi:hypothetical protein MMC25_001162 [Agyrium rufum]|nr:hypothetical protein [Agyrium rufum]